MPKRVHADRPNSTLELEWADGHVTQYDFTTLRSLGGGAGTPRPDAATPQAAEHVPAHASKES